MPGEVGALGRVMNGLEPCWVPFPGFIPLYFPLLESSPHSPCEALPSEAALTPRPEGKVPSRLALGSRGGYNGRGWGSPGRPKKKHTGMTALGMTQRGGHS